MDVDQLFATLEGFTNLERTPGRSMRPYRLDRMRLLLEKFDNPHLSLKVIHVAGSKGKGSTCAFLARILDAAGHVTGLYTSPHVSSYKERITFAGKEIADEELIAAFHELEHGLPDWRVPELAGQSSPTTFELLTILAFLVFRRTTCEWAVIETGIGGRLDATNLVSPVCSVITPIEREHTEILGDTITEIAGEKAGIIKPGKPVYVGYQSTEATRVLAERAGEVGSSTQFLAEQLESRDLTHTDTGPLLELVWSNGKIDRLELGMWGDVQGDNAALAVMTARALFAESMQSTTELETAIATGIKTASLPGRMERLAYDPPVILDAAHTPSSIARLVGSLCTMYEPPRHLVFGSVLGKDHREMARLLAPHFDRIVVSQPGTFKSSDPEAVFQAFSSLHAKTVLETDAVKALEHARNGAKPPAVILVTGSFYMISEIRRVAAQKDQPCFPDD